MMCIPLEVFAWYLKWNRIKKYFWCRWSIVFAQALTELDYSIQLHTGDYDGSAIFIVFTT